MSAVLAALAVALQSTGHMLTIVCVGGIAAHKRVVDPGTRARFAQIVMCVFFPALMLGNAGNYDASYLLRVLPLQLVSVGHIVLGASLALLLARLLGFVGADRRNLIMMTAFNNSAGLPFMLTSAICVSWERLAEDANSRREAFVLIMLYQFPWTLLLFGAGRRFLWWHALSGGSTLGSAVGGLGERALGEGASDLGDDQKDLASGHRLAEMAVTSSETPPSEMPPSTDAERGVAPARAVPTSPIRPRASNGLTSRASAAMGAFSALIDVVMTSIGRHSAISASVLSLCIACIAPLRSLLFESQVYFSLAQPHSFPYLTPHSFYISPTRFFRIAARVCRGSARSAGQLLAAVVDDRDGNGTPCFTRRAPTRRCPCKAAAPMAIGASPSSAESQP